MRSSTGWVFVLGVIAGCGDQIVEPDPLDEAAAFAQGRLEALEVLRRAPDGVPGIVSGDLGVAVDPTSELDVRAAIAPYLPAYRVRDADLVLQRVFVAENDDRLYRFTQLDDGVEVVGGLVVAHVDAGGRVFALSTKARGPDSLAGAARPRLDPDAIARLPGTPVIGVRFIYYITEDAVRRPAYEVRRAGTGLGEEVEYLDADDGTLLARNDGFRAANRSIYRYLGSGLLPGQARRAEGAPADTVAAVNMAYEHTGTTRSAYTKFWNRP